MLEKLKKVFLELMMWDGDGDEKKPEALYGYCMLCGNKLKYKSKVLIFDQNTGEPKEWLHTLYCDYYMLHEHDRTETFAKDKTKSPSMPYRFLLKNREEE